MKQPIQELIRKFWAGELNDAEKKHLIERLQQTDGEWMAQLRASYLQTLQSDTAPANDAFFDDQYDLLLKKVDVISGIQPAINNRPLGVSDTGRSKTSPTNAVTFGRINQMLRYWPAAAIAAFIIGTTLLYFNNATTTTKKIAATEHGQPAATTLAITSISNTTDSFYYSRLPDGSLIRLSAGASISYDTSFGQQTRSIHLQHGEVYFVVAKDKKHPFIVNANNVLVRAVGTAFTVTCNSNAQLSVLMEEGRVAVTTELAISTEDILLSAGDELNLDLSKKTLRIQNNKQTGKAEPAKTTEEQTKSKRTVLPVFRQTPLQTVFESLSRHYGVSIQFTKQEVKGLWFTGEFTGRETIASNLATICRMNKLEVLFNGKEYLIQKK